MAEIEHLKMQSGFQDLDETPNGNYTKVIHTKNGKTESPNPEERDIHKRSQSMQIP